MSCLPGRRIPCLSTWYRYINAEDVGTVRSVTTDIIRNLALSGISDAAQCSRDFPRRNS